MKFLILLLLLSLNAFAAFTPFPPVVTPPDVLVTKGGLLTSTGAAQVEQTGCADGEIIQWDVAEANGFKCVAASSGSGGVNYLEETQDSNFEIGLGNWVAFDDGAVSVPSDGNGGSPTLTCTRNTTLPIRGAGDLQLLAAASDMQGEGCAADFDIDKGMKGQKLTGLFWLDTSAANYADDDLAVFVYDKTNTNIIRVNGEGIKGSKGKHYFQFQAASDSTSYRLILMVQSTTTLGYSIYFDQVAVGPTNIARGSIVTDWEAFTPTGSFTTAVTYTGFKRRVGDSEEYDITLTFSGLTNSAGLNIDTPNTIDTTKISLASSRGTTLGTSTFYDSGVRVWDGAIVYNNANSVLVSTGESANLGLGDNTNPFTYNSGDSLSVKFTIPIVGWSSDTAFSSDLGGHEIAINVVGNGGELLVANVTDIPFATVTGTNTDLWDGSKFTANESAYYLLEGSVRSTTASSAELRIYVNGVNPSDSLVSHFDSSIYGFFTKRVYLNKGDTLSLRTDIGFTLNSAGSAITITKLASPQTALETARTTLFATNTSGLSIGNASWIQSTGFTAETDDIGGFASNQYTISNTGVYLICATAHWATNATGQRGVRIRVDNGDSGIGSFIQSSAALGTIHGACGLKDLNKGQLIKVEVYQNSGGGLLLAAATDVANSLSIMRVK